MTTDPDNLKGFDHGEIVTRLMADLRATIAQQDSERRSERAKQAWRRRKGEGA